jgi:hypothetical protein
MYHLECCSSHLLDSFLNGRLEQLLCRIATPALALSREGMLHHMPTYCSEHNLPCLPVVQAKRERVIGHSTEPAAVSMNYLYLKYSIVSCLSRGWMISDTLLTRRELASVETFGHLAANHRLFRHTQHLFESCDHGGAKGTSDEAVSVSAHSNRLLLQAGQLRRSSVARVK